MCDNQEWPKKVEWLGIARWECSNGVLWQEDSKALAKEYQAKLDKEEESKGERGKGNA